MAGIDVKNALELKGGLGGLKTILGAALIVLSHQLAAANDLMPLFPDSHSLALIAGYLSSGIALVSKGTAILGNGFLGLGGLDKIRKLFKLW